MTEQQKPGWFDRTIARIAPQWALKRETSRYLLDQTRKFHQLAYESSEFTRFNHQWLPLQRAGDVESGARELLRRKAWHLYRNDPRVVSIVKNITGRIAPPRLAPEPLATLNDGEPDVLVQKRLKQLWKRFSVECSTLGFPGRGGLTINALFEQILREVILSGECLVYFRRHSPAEAEAWGLTIPLTIDVIEAERLDHRFITSVIPPHKGNRMYEGIEIDENNRRVAYHILKSHPNHPLTYSLETIRVPAEDVLHIYIPNRASSQFRGYSWLSCSLDMFRTIGDFEFNELQASTTAACPALVIKQTAGLGAPTLAPFPSDDPSVDSDGNRKMFFQPGMIPVMRTGEDIVGFNSNRPNDKCEDFTKHLLRQICGAFPLKASEIHGDYRESSFSSEASAECSLMPYVLALHEWFVSSVCEPIFEEVVLAGRLNGYLNGFEQGEGDIYERRLTEASYPLPEIRSINPTNDVKAAVMRVAAGFSSPQQEAAKFGNNDWESVIDQTAQYVAKLKEKDLPPEYGLAVLGVKTSIALKDLPGEGERDPDKQDDDGDDPEQADKDEKPKPKKPSSAA